MTQIFQLLVNYRFYVMAFLIFLVIADYLAARRRDPRETLLNVSMFLIGLVIHASVTACSLSANQKGPGRGPSYFITLLRNSEMLRDFIS